MGTKEFIFLVIEMENLCLKFPYLCSIIFANLDNKSLVQCRLVNKSWKKLIDNEKILWKRILKKYITNLTSKCWYEILVKIPVDIIREIATAVNQTFMSQLQDIKEALICHPLEIAAQ